MREPQSAADYAAVEAASLPETEGLPAPWSGPRLDTPELRASYAAARADEAEVWYASREARLATAKEQRVRALAAARVRFDADAARVARR